MSASAIRLPLLCAFAGGCLSNAVLFGLWRIAERAGDSSATQHRTQNVVELVTAASAAPSVAQPSELVAANAADPGHRVATEAAPTPAASDLDNEEPTPAGSAVSDVLTRLEAAYRERVGARAPAQTSSAQDRATAAASADGALTAAQAAPSVPTPPVAEVIPAMPVAAATAPAANAPEVTAPAAIAPAAPAPAAPATATLAQQVAAVPAFGGQDAPPPTEIHYGDVNQNTYITNIREGDVYLMQMQQVAMLQYMQLLGMSSGLAAPARHVRGAVHQRGALSSGITNPDNPWGFHFAPPNLVR